jgi:hypothetical protein
MPAHDETGTALSLHLVADAVVRSEAFRLLSFPIPESERASVTVLCVPFRGFVFVQELSGPPKALFVRAVEGTRGMMEALPLLLQYARENECASVETVALSESRQRLFTAAGFRPSATKPGTLFINLE